LKNLAELGDSLLFLGSDSLNVSPRVNPESFQAGLSRICFFSDGARVPALLTLNKKWRGASNARGSTFPAASALCGHGDAFSILNLDASF
jgi:hypothetical protein